MSDEQASPQEGDACFWQKNRGRTGAYRTPFRKSILTCERIFAILKRDRTVASLLGGGSVVKDTKERILMAALDMFSQKGYAGTNIRELTGSLGLGKSSLYRHFARKEEIWNTLLDEMIAYYEARFGSTEQLPPAPDSPEDLVALTRRMVDFIVHDEKVVKSRKLLSLEQFRDERARDLATKYFLMGLTDMFTPIFKGMMDRGLLRRDDPRMLAFAYTAPISALIHLCDREPEKEEDAMAQVEAFSRHFIRIYGATDNG